jgi:outer membrane autotransporter protein/uncharacterized repeat protein (TIGR01451 family)
MAKSLSKVGSALFFLSMVLAWAGPAWADPHLSLTETQPSNADGDNSHSVTVGDVLTYTITARNDGDVILTNVQITDGLLTPSSATCASVAINATCVLTGTHQVSTADAAAGQIFDNPDATANETPDSFDTGLVTPVAASGGAAMTVVVTLNNYNDADHDNTSTAGDQVQVVVNVNNAGSVPLTNVHVSSSHGAPSSTTCATVAVGGTCLLSATYTLTTADVAPNAVVPFTGSATSNEVPGPVSFTSEGEFEGGSVDQAQMVIVSGDNQGGAPGSTLPVPLRVRLLSPTGAPVSGQRLEFLIGLGTASLSNTSAVTDSQGEASTQLVLGSTPGPVGVYVVPDDSNGPSVWFTENITGLASASTLSIVSGDGQSLVPNVASSPLVVALKDASNAPIAGATINWSTSAGTLEHASTVTDSSGESSNTVTTSESGPVSVTASSPLASSAVSFALSASLVELPNLTPEQHAVAEAIDNACPALSELSSPTPQQADLLARCQDLSASAGVDPSATADALETLLNKTAEAQTTAAAVAIDAQIHNIQTRLLALRTGTATSNANGLSFTGPGGTISLGSLLGAFSNEAPEPAADAGFSRWGFFATGNIGRGEARSNSASPGYDYDINGITAGIDYRLQDNWLLGGALGYTRQDTDLADDSGEVRFNGWSASAYSTYSFKQSWYVDGVLTYGHNQLSIDRVIRYTLDLPGGGSTSIDQLASGDPDGSLFSAALTFGGDFHHQAWAFSPYGQVVYSRVDFDAYEESMRPGAGSGLALAVEERRITSLAGILGTRVSFNHSTNWGVVAPTASLEWNHEFRSDPTATIARFLYDPTQTSFSVSGQSLDSDYLRLGVGLTLVASHGRSGFLFYQRTLAREGQSQDELSLGLRIEF